MTAPDTPPIRFSSLAEAKAHPGAWVLLEADCGGQFLLSIPASQVACDEPTLDRLLSDLEAITWGHGFDANDPGNCVDAQLSYYSAAHPLDHTDSLVIHEELEVELLLHDQIARVLRGEQPRLQLEHHFPNSPILSLQEAKRFPNARVYLYSNQGCQRLVDCAARIVEIDESGLSGLICDLDAWIGWPSAITKSATGPRILYTRQDSPPSFDLLNADLRLDTRILLPLHDEINRVLRGQQTRIAARPRVHHLTTDRGETIEVTLLPGERFLCPVCASICFGDPPYLRPSDPHGKRIDLYDRHHSPTPPLNICRVCATHFGVSDFPEDFPGLSLMQIWERLRARWLSQSTTLESDRARVRDAFGGSSSKADHVCD